MNVELDWIAFFEPANNRFLSENRELFLDKLSERTLCGCLSQILFDDLKRTSFADYYVDVEYNRNNKKLKTMVDGDCKVLTINCDLIIHSRGKNPGKDNLLNFRTCLISYNYPIVRYFSCTPEPKIATVP